MYIITKQLLILMQHQCAILTLNLNILLHSSWIGQIDIKIQFSLSVSECSTDHRTYTCDRPATATV